jgi:8-oxo-dGTP diphosphatase
MNNPGLTDGHRLDGRIYPRFPLPGVGVVVFKEKRLLLIKRGHEPHKGQWSVPGGAIEVGETIAEAAGRETLEECSIKIDIVGLLDTADIIVKDDDGRVRYHYVIIDLLANYRDGKLEARSDAAEAGWFTPQEAAAMDLTETLRSLLEKHKIIKQGGE